MNRVLISAGAALCSALLLLFGGATEAATASNGVATSAMNGWALHSLSQSQYNQQVAAMQAAGVQVLRVDASWQNIQPTSGAPYQWSAYDYQVAAMASHHITWLPVLDYSTTWGASVPGDWRSPPADDAQFAAFAKAVASRYGANGSFWSQHPGLPYRPVRMYEVWNEENGSEYWDTGPDPTGYSLLYQATRNAIRSVDSSASVIIGGLTTSGTLTAAAFLQAMYTAVPSLKGNVDGVGFHPYEANYVDLAFAVMNLRGVLDALGEHYVPIDVTEFGWPYSPTQESWRASQMQQVATTTARSDCGVQLMAPYDWYNPSGSGTDFGLSDGSSLRAAGTAWFSGLASDASLPTLAMCY